MLRHIRLNACTIMVVVPGLELQPILVSEQRPHQEDEVSVEVTTGSRDRSLDKRRGLFGAKPRGQGLLEEQLGPLLHTVPGGAFRIAHLIRVNPCVVIRRDGLVAKSLQQLRVLQKSLCPCGHQLGPRQLQEAVQRLSLT